MPILPLPTLPTLSPPSPPSDLARSRPISQVTLEDFRQALQTTQPSTGGDEHAAYKSWNDEYGSKR